MLDGQYKLQTCIKKGINMLLLWNSWIWVYIFRISVVYV